MTTYRESTQSGLVFTALDRINDMAGHYVPNALERQCCPSPVPVCHPEAPRCRKLRPLDRASVQSSAYHNAYDLLWLAALRLQTHGYSD